MDTPNRQATVDSRRIALEREVELRFPAFDNFVTEYSANISTTGMFITSDSPQAAGTTFAFEFSVADDWKLIRGKAQVVWARYKGDGPNRPPGMGVRFTELDPQSRRLIRWIVEKHIREGGKPFELDELRSVIDEALEHALEPDGEPGTEQAKPAAAAPRSLRPASPVVPPAKRARRKPFTVQPWMMVVAAVAVIGLLIWLSEVGGRLAGRGSAEAQSSRAAAAAAPDESADATSDAASADTPAAATGAPATATAAANPAAAGAGNGPSAASRPDAGLIAATVEEWAEAWSKQDVGAYLSHYASDFRPADGSSRQAWAAVRRERIERPEYIRVAISGLETEIVAPDRAEVSFFQSYKSDTFGDEVRKTVVLVWQDDGWKIAAERSAG